MYVIGAKGHQKPQLNNMENNKKIYGNTNGFTMKKVSPVSVDSNFKGTKGYFVAMEHEGKYYLRNAAKKEKNDQIRTDVEIYFQTKSGNIYRIYESRNKDIQGCPWVLINMKTGERYQLTLGELRYAFIEIDWNFTFGNTVTNKITKIQTVTVSGTNFNVDDKEEATLPGLFKSGLEAGIKERKIKEKEEKKK